jgi:hypothetical protein
MSAIADQVTALDDEHKRWPDVSELLHRRVPTARQREDAPVLTRSPLAPEGRAGQMQS